MRAVPKSPDAVTKSGQKYHSIHAKGGSVKDLIAEESSRWARPACLAMHSSEADMASRAKATASEIGNHVGDQKASALPDDEEGEAMSVSDEKSGKVSSLPPLRESRAIMFLGLRSEGVDVHYRKILTQDRTRGPARQIRHCTTEQTKFQSHSHHRPSWVQVSRSRKPRQGVGRLMRGTPRRERFADEASSPGRIPQEAHDGVVLCRILHRSVRGTAEVAAAASRVVLAQSAAANACQATHGFSRDYDLVQDQRGCTRQEGMNPHARRIAKTCRVIASSAGDEDGWWDFATRGVAPCRGWNRLADTPCRACVRAQAPATTQLRMNGAGAATVAIILQQLCRDCGLVSGGSLDGPNMVSHASIR